MKFSALLLFSVGWLTLVYLPICHMTWGGAGGLFYDLGVFDFAGGIVVHVTAGVAALVLCMLVGTRRGWPTQFMPPHNLTMTVTGAGDLSIPRLLGAQLFCALVAALYTASVSYALARSIDLLLGLRIDELGEEQGLDLLQHGETGYNY